jgi:hypothetical protein
MSAQAQTLLAGAALVMLGLLTGCLVFVAVPQGNQQLVTFALGALAGATTVGGVGRIGGASRPGGEPPSPQP